MTHVVLHNGLTVIKNPNNNYFLLQQRSVNVSVTLYLIVFNLLQLPGELGGNWLDWISEE